MAKDEETDGGRAAIAGFLYQLTGTAGLVAWARIAQDATAPANQLADVFKAVLQGEVVPEPFDQDAGILMPPPPNLGLSHLGDCILIQFKFSLNGKQSPIGQKEFLEIIWRLRAGAERARKSQHRVTGYLLITNRGLGPTAKQIVSEVSAGKPVFRSFSKKRYRVQSPQATIIKQLLVPDSLQLEDWEQALVKYAHKLGCEQSDIQQGIGQLVHQMMRQALEDFVPVTEKTLRRAFTGEDEARPLVITGLTEETVAHLDQTFKAQLGLYEKPPVPRNLLGTLKDEVKRHALVVLYGDGGCGKTIALWQWTHEALRAADAGEGGIAVMHPAQRVTLEDLTFQICNWAHLSSMHRWRSTDRDPVRALKRLERANLDVPQPILCLGLDELDASKLADQEQRLIEVLLWFYKQELHLQEQLASNLMSRPLATLIVTCRTKSDVVHRLTSDQSEVLGYELCAIPVTNFSSDELAAVARQFLPDHLAATVVAAGADLSGPAGSSRVRGEATLFPTPYGAPLTPADPEVLKIFAHPAMWEALLAMKESALQEAALRLQEEGLTHLAEKWVQRFLRKARVRGQKPNHEPTLLRALGAIAQRSFESALTPLKRNTDWIEQAAGLGYSEGAQLYEEALSHGVILEQAEGIWIWRHPFVTTYLCSCYR